MVLNRFMLVRIRVARQVRARIARLASSTMVLLCMYVIVGIAVQNDDDDDDDADYSQGTDTDEEQSDSDESFESECESECQEDSTESDSECDDAEDSENGEIDECELDVEERDKMRACAKVLSSLRFTSAQKLAKRRTASKHISPSSPRKQSSPTKSKPSQSGAAPALAEGASTSKASPPKRVAQFNHRMVGTRTSTPAAAVGSPARRMSVPRKPASLKPGRTKPPLGVRFEGFIAPAAPAPTPPQGAAAQGAAAQGADAQGAAEIDEFFAEFDMDKHNNMEGAAAQGAAAQGAAAQGAEIDKFFAEFDMDKYKKMEEAVTKSRDESLKRKRAGPKKKHFASRGSYDAAQLWIVWQIKSQSVRAKERAKAGDPEPMLVFPLTLSELKVAASASYDDLLSTLLTLDGHHSFMKMRNAGIMVKDTRRVNGKLVSRFDLTPQGMARANELDVKYGEYAGFSQKHKTILEGPRAAVRLHAALLYAQYSHSCNTVVCADFSP